MSVLRNPEADRAAEFNYELQPWNGPDDYVIVYAAGDKHSNRSARLVKEFLIRKTGRNIAIVDDTAAPCQKEILVGDTNRRKTQLGNTEFATKLEGERLIFEGGHYVMVEKAIKWFFSKFRFGNAVILSGTAQDFATQINIGGENYEYVWGDEFDGDFLDNTKFGFNYHMPNKSLETAVLYDSRVMRVEDGLLKLTSGLATPQDHIKEKYKVCGSICSGDTMWWKYGYMEMRARVPMKRGCWPGYWALGHCRSLGDTTDKWDYLAEIDIFEVFGQTTEFVPCLHKWYKNYTGTYTELYDEKGEVYRHSAPNSPENKPQRYYLPDSQENSYVYRTFGFKWDENSMTMSIDGEDYMTFDLNQNFDTLSDMSGFKNQPLHIIFDNWLYTPGGWECHDWNQVRDEDLPAEYFVDYIRLYQKPGEGELEDLGLEMDFKF